jgi:prophage regulatory protein
MNGQSILRLREVLRRLSISRSAFYQLVKSGKFSRPINLGGARSVGWLESDVTSYIESRIKASRPDTKGTAA